MGVLYLCLTTVRWGSSNGSRMENVLLLSSFRILNGVLSHYPLKQNLSDISSKIMNKSVAQTDFFRKNLMIHYQFTLKSWQIWLEFMRASYETLEKITVVCFVIEESLVDPTEVFKRIVQPNLVIYMWFRALHTFSFTDYKRTYLEESWEPNTIALHFHCIDNNSTETFLKIFFYVPQKKERQFGDDMLA